MRLYEKNNVNLGNDIVNFFILGRNIFVLYIYIIKLDVFFYVNNAKPILYTLPLASLFACCIILLVIIIIFSMTMNNITSVMIIPTPSLVNLVALTAHTTCTLGLFCTFDYITLYIVLSCLSAILFISHE